MYEKWMRFLAVGWDLVFGGASLVCFVAAIVSLVVGGQHADRLLLFAIYTLLLARGGEGR